ncbi:MULTISPECIES: F0F1 ATP synthase subunit gamma [Brucella]|jgi:F-type H+-transporting ATPase subunit gamma|uniref:ATP synthase gamma chain n=1 Tax=Brucella pseudogrignonensis TaxID=419475 RepID=A0A1A9FLG7_9HYPH|nr:MULTISPECIES: F0F1 ATP synthase subunit gamma [Brucella]EMG53652.1 F0F1 ATP synthase subunit gamma [Ochrobactrum sp. CDB2]MBK0023449.1 F0F1 ATP synthase subunit gamma [Ochrobactrum sp. S45]MBK0045181.1 F0F1 ATP synthase subunit gamma [Ochrobactrum sp. S46]MBO1026258.1 F0F1 ATP synthase subunit gamma [Ochrobactrum sp. SD129]MQP42244.1 F0F1 ATP synthase subunit gamma [Ochrobactrum sp. MYb237]PRA85184.1 F0F1 ATP synthase subunit gamma [Ochrobactrum sp. MYb29]QWK77324.1 F0F1 ATP synthase subu
MPSLKDLRNRIASVKATQKITKAMQMVAAAKLRRAQEAAEAARPYSQRMGAVLANIAQNVSGEDAPALMAGTGKDDVHLLVVATAERGLCGGFNSQIARYARDHARKLLAEGKTVKILTIGKKGADILRREFASLIIDHVNLREVKQLAFVHADQIGHKIIELFEQGAFDVCTLFYSEFKSVIAQIPTAQQIIPASAGNAEQADTAGDAIYEYEPDPAAILSTLIPRNISVQIFRALLENVAGEMGAKMSAMDNATRNAGDMINKLSITYNRQRQAQITKELIEIISGAEAL